jgi:hypothetical protein
MGYSGGKNEESEKLVMKERMRVARVGGREENEFVKIKKKEKKKNASNSSEFNLTFRHRASCVLGPAFHYSPENAFYIFNQQIYFII